MKYEITTEQIDAAAAWIENIYNGPHEPRLNMITAEVVKTFLWSLLRQFGIYRCEGCGGSGDTRPLSRPNDAPPVPCVDCNGHGWTKP